MNNSLDNIAKLVQGTLIGDASIIISSLAPINEIIPGSLVFADSKENLQLAETSSAAAVLVSTKITQSNKPLIQVPHPFKAFIQLLNHFNPPPPITPGIHPTAVIGDHVKLGEGVSIGPYVVIESGAVIESHSVLKSHIHVGQNVQIGEYCTIYPHVTIYDDTRIGSQVIIHASTVIGSDGFGYTFTEGQHLKVPHLGRVEIHDQVEIGANTAIDRATMGTTVIGKGTKIDNLVQIAHSVKLGKHNILCAFTGVAGSSTSGDYVIFAANVGVSDHVKIDDNVILGARTGVPPHKHLKEGQVYLGTPARPKDLAIKHDLSVTRIPFMRKHIKTLQEQMNELTKYIASMEKEEL